MSKTLELHGVYETRGGECTAEVACVDLGASDSTYPCLVIYTNKITGVKTDRVVTKTGKVSYFDAGNSIFDLIIPNPEPKWRAWKVEEIPVGARVRRKDNQAIETLILKNTSLFVGAGQMRPYLLFFEGRSSASDALEELEYFNGTTWQPCGVLE
jgi:hypothetical protein